MSRRSSSLSVLAIGMLVFLYPVFHSPKSVAAAQNSSGKLHAAVANSGAGNMDGGMGLSSKTYSFSGAFWRTDGAFISTIRIKNLLVVAPLDVIPTLFMADGTPYVLPSVHIPTNGAVTIDINDALAAAPPSVARHFSSYGTAMLMWTYTSEGHMAASIANIDATRSLIFMSPFAMPMSQSGHQALDGLWWKHDPHVQGFLAISNTGDAPTRATLQLVGPGVETQPARAISLAPRSTRLLTLEDLATNIAALDHNAGGIHVEYTGDSVQVYGGLENDTIGYSANMPFWQDDMSSTAPAPISYAFAGVLLGRPDPMMMPGFPKETRFKPYLALRNTTEKPLDVSLQLNYMAGPSAVNRPLRTERLAPFESRQVDLRPALLAARLKDFDGSINLSASFTGKQGDLIASSGSVDQTGSYVFEVLVQGIGQTRSKYSDYWSAAGGNDTMVSLWNPTDTAQDIVATFDFGDGSGSYNVPLHLGPQGSAMIDVRVLISQNKPDPSGNVFPPNIRDGGVQFASASGTHALMNLVIASGIYDVQSATCGCDCICCCPPSDIGITPGTFSLAVGDQMACQVTTVDCNGSDWNPTSWSSSNTSVITVDQSGNVRAVALGGATIYAYWNQVPDSNACNLPGPCPLTNERSQAAGNVVGITTSVQARSSLAHPVVCRSTAANSAA